MTGEQQIRCIKAIAYNIQQMANLKFPVYGSLYFDNIAIKNATTLPFDRDLCIGPDCGSRYWGCTVGDVRFYDRVKPNRGSCKAVPLPI